MPYQPVIPLGGLVGWAFLNRTLDRQSEAFDAAPDVKRDTDYFAENIGKIDTAEQLVNDRRLLRVALGAFGLQDDINNKYFVQRMLADGTINADALANRMADDRYLQFSKAFGFGDFGVPRTKLSYFSDEILGQYRKRAFEEAVGEQDENLRLALNAKRELVDIADEASGNDTKWFRIMGNAPLRAVFETALGLPDSFGQIDLDQQLDVFKEKAKQQLGTSDISEFSDEALVEKLVEKFLVRSQISDVQSTGSGAIALTLLQSAVPQSGLTL